MFYFDTSFLVPYVAPEPESAAVQRVVDTLAPNSLAVSSWTVLEFSSVLAAGNREGKWSAKQTKAADARLDQLCRASFRLWSTTDDDLRAARGYVQRAGVAIRGGDALHFAIATRQNATMVYTLDKGMLKAGRKLGMPVTRGI